jgi:RNA polymerase sigma-70 factor (ECF subfamily)
MNGEPALRTTLPADIEQWIMQVKQGRKEAYRTIIEFYQVPLYRYAYHLLRSREEAEDAVQDVFFQAYRHLDDYSEQVSFSAWLYKIAYRHCLNLIRKRKSLLTRLHLFKGESVPADHDSSLRVGEILRGLSQAEKQIMILRAVEEMTFDEIALILNSRPATVRKRFERIRKKMMQNYAEEEEKNRGESWTSAARPR